MNPSAIQSASNEHVIVWAIICSILLHGLLALVIPNLKFDDLKKPDVLEILLTKQAPPAQPAPPAPPKLSEPPTKTTEPKIIPKSKLKSAPTPVIKQQPSPILQDLPPVTEAPPVTTQQEVIAVAAAPERPTPIQSTPIVAPSIKESPPLPSKAEVDNANGRYGNSLWNAISKHKKYPKIAQMRGWQGETIIELELDGNGKLKSKKITQSSGYEALDKQALEMIEKALPFPAPPEALRNSNFTITIPVPFKLE